MAELINCLACNNEIATTANACPKCGAANEWIHPSIQRFLEDIKAAKISWNKSGQLSDLLYNWNRYSIAGTAETKKESWLPRWIRIPGNLLFGLFFLFDVIPSLWAVSYSDVIPGIIFLMFLFIVLVAMNWSSSKKLNFSIDFKSKPPTWKSDDEEAWEGLREYFIANSKEEQG